MKVSLRKILSENLPSYSWLASIVDPVNKIVDDVSRALKNGLTFADNYDGGGLRAATVDGTFPVYCSWDRSSKPVGFVLVSCRELTGDHTAFSAAVGLDAEWDGSRIKINAVPGITATPTSKYVITFLPITG